MKEKYQYEFPPQYLQLINFTESAAAVDLRKSRGSLTPALSDVSTTISATSKGFWHFDLVGIRSMFPK